MDRGFESRRKLYTSFLVSRRMNPFSSENPSFCTLLNMTKLCWWMQGFCLMKYYNSDNEHHLPGGLLLRTEMQIFTTASIVPGMQEIQKKKGVKSWDLTWMCNDHSVDQSYDGQVWCLIFGRGSIPGAIHGNSPQSNVNSIGLHHGQSMH